jgi:hypothetical protein
MATITFTPSQTLLDAIDAARGDLSRASWMRRIATEAVSSPPDSPSTTFVVTKNPDGTITVTDP